MKKLFTTITLVAFCQLLVAQGLNFNWAKSFDADHSISVTNCVCANANQQTYSTGYFSNTIDFNMNLSFANKLASRGGHDIFILKLDTLGKYVWAVSIGGNLNDEGKSLVTDANGNVYVTGFFQGTVDFDPGAGIYNLSSNGDKDMFMLKLDSTGAFVWAKQLGGLNEDQASSIKIDLTGNIFISGTFQGTMDADPGASTSFMTSIGGHDMLIEKLDFAGNLIWAKQFGGPSDDRMTSISIDNSNRVYATGSFQGSADFDPSASVYNLNAVGNSDIFVLKIDQSGSLNWVKQFGGNNDESGQGIAVESSGSVITVGEFQGNVDFDPGVSGTFNYASNGDNDIFITKLDSSGNFTWAKKIGDVSNDIAFDVKINSLNELVFTGVYTGTVDFNPGTTVNNLINSGAFVAKLNSNGDYVWAVSFSKPTLLTISPIGYSVALDNANNIYTGGKFSNSALWSPLGSYVLNDYGHDTIAAYASKISTTAVLKWAYNSVSCLDKYPTAIQLDSFGNVYSSGVYSSNVDFDPSSSATYIMPSLEQYQRTYLSKLDATGNFIWALNFKDYLVGSVHIDQAGNSFVAGTFTGTVDMDPGPGISNLTAPGGEVHFFFSKLDATGNLLWVKQLVSHSTLYYQKTISCITVDDYGHIFIGGRTNSTIDFNPGPSIDTIGLNAGGFLAKYDTSGNFIWAKDVGGYTYELNFDLNQDLFLLGNFDNANIDFDPGVGFYTLAANSTDGRFVTKLDSSANFLWARGWSPFLITNPYISAPDMDVDENGNSFIILKIGSTDIDPSLSVSLILDGCYVVKLNPQGNMLWYVSPYQGFQSIGANALKLNSNADFYVGGAFIGTNIDLDPGPGVFYLSTNPGLYSSIISVFDSSGIFLNAKTFSGNADNKCYQMAIDHNQQIYVTGIYNGQCDFDPGPANAIMTATGTNDIYIEKMGACLSTDSSISLSACNSYSWNSQTYTVNGIYQQNFVNAAGCDSMVYLNLSIGNTPSSSSINQTSCDSYLFNGQTITASGTYLDTLVNAVGCDSVITLNLIINAVNTSVNQSGISCTANANGATYQWINCAGNTLINGATNQTYTATANGNYAVIVTQNGCTDTSSCYTVSTVGIHEIPSDNLFYITPNPSNGMFDIMLHPTMKDATVLVLNSLGQKIMALKNVAETKLNIDLSLQSSGVYVLQVIKNGEVFNQKLIKK